MNNSPVSYQKKMAASAATQLMNEHVRLIGVPQVIVTRAYQREWLISTGFDGPAEGIGSLDWMVFGVSAVREPLTDLIPLARFLGYVRENILGDICEGD